MKKWICILLCILALGAMPLTSYAHNLPLVVDYADILSDEEELLLQQKAQVLQEEYAMDALILTIHTLEDQTAMDYAADYYDYEGYGTDHERSGTVFLLAMDEREWYIDTSGDAIYALTDYALLQQEDMILPYLRSGDYYGAFDIWLDSLDGYFEAYLSGAPIDGIIPEEDRYDGHDDTVYYEEAPTVNWGISVIAGLLAAGITVGIMYAMMNTRRRQNSAAEYMKTGSYNLSVRRDVFLYSQVSKTRRESSSSSSSGGRSGGSSVHRSSSGRSHGGRGGKF